jgi:hypothetical protein
LLHIKPERLFPILEAVKGLSLDEALLQMKWYQKPVGDAFTTVLKESIVKLKEEGYNLSKTYIGTFSNIKYSVADL